MEELEKKIALLEEENKRQTDYAKVWESLYLVSLEKTTALEAKLTAVKSLITIL